MFLSRGLRVALSGPCDALPALRELVVRALATNSHAPVLRWDVTAMRAGGTSATYGAFLSRSAFSSDAGAFEISRAEARGFDPMVMLILETSYGVFRDSASSSCRAELANSLVGFFLGAGGSIAS